jgi:hypothetical protein
MFNQDSVQKMESREHSGTSWADVLKAGMKGIDYDYSY